LETAQVPVEKFEGGVWGCKRVDQGLDEPFVEPNKKKKKKRGGWRDKLDVLTALVLVAQLAALPRQREGLFSAFIELEEDVGTEISGPEWDACSVELFRRHGQD